MMSRVRCQIVMHGLALGLLAAACGTQESPGSEQPGLAGPGSPSAMPSGPAPAAPGADGQAAQQGVPPVAMQPGQSPPASQPVMPPASEPPMSAAGSGASGQAGSTAPVPAAETLLTSGIVMPQVPAGGQETVCIRRRLQNTTRVPVIELRGFIHDGSHHLILDRSNEPDEALTPFPCSDLQGSDESRFLIAQQHETTFTLPEGVAFWLEPQQMVTIELHYINVTSDPLDVAAEVELVVGEEGVDYQAASMLFTGQIGFSLPPGQQTPVDFFTPVGGAGNPVKVFALTSHTHSLGIQATISRAPSPGAQGTLLHESLDWAEPPLTRFDEPLTFDGSDGLQLRCIFDNTTDRTVHFGRRFEDEMCFLWLYSYDASAR